MKFKFLVLEQSPDIFLDPKHGTVVFGLRLLVQQLTITLQTSKRDIYKLFDAANFHTRKKGATDVDIQNVWSMFQAG
jgi:hypothetical protein